MSPLLSGSNRSLAESGVNLTLVASLRTAAATAQQKSTSKPVQFPLSSGFESHCRLCFTPQMRELRSFTALRVCACDCVAARPNALALEQTNNARFMHSL